MLTVSKGGNGSTVPATQFVLTGKDLVHAANDKATAGYILKLSAEGTNNQSFTINDTSDSVAIPDSGWVHIVVDMNSADRTKATLTITDKSTGKALVSDKEITVNGTGELSGIYLMLGRGTSSCIKLDNTLVKKPGIADYAQLNTVLARAKKYVRQHTASPVYSEASMAALNQAIQAAEALSPSLTDDQQEQVDACAEALKTAIAGLTCKEHSYNKGTILEQATCAKEGKKEFICYYCGDRKEVVLAKKNHVAGSWETTKKATTTSEGERVKKCTQCGIVLQTEKIAKLQNTGGSGNSDDKTDLVKAGAVYKVGSLKYKVTDVKKKTVTVTGPKKKSAKIVTIGKTVKIKGISFKITQIGNNAFSKCKKLKKVTIGANVTKIGKKAFYKDTKLKSIVVKTKKLKSVGSQAFKGIYKKAKIKVPSSRLKKYKKLFKKKGQARTVKIKK